MISARTAATLCEVSLPTIHAWVRNHNIGNVSEAGPDGKYAKYEVDPVALFFHSSGAVHELDFYINGRLDPDHAQSVRSALGVGDHGGDDMTRKQPLLIEHSRPHIDADVRRAIFRIAEARGLKPLEVLVAGFDPAKADAALQEAGS